MPERETNQRHTTYTTQGIKQKAGGEDEWKKSDHHADNKKAEEKLDIFNKSFVRSRMGAIVHDVYIKRCP